MSIKHIKSIKPGEADGIVNEVYSQIKAEMGDVVEPMSLHSIIPELLVGIWGILREVVLVNDKVIRKYKEAVGAAVSSSNECPYCVDAHTIMIIGLKDKEMAKAIVKKDPNLVSNSRVRELIHWAFETRNFKSVTVNKPPFNKYEAPEIIGTAVFFHYLNRLVTIFLGETILPLNISFLKEAMKKMAAGMFSKVLSTEKQAGNYDGKFSGPGFSDIYWARSNERIDWVFSHFYTVVDELAERYVPMEVMAFIKDQVMNWDGGDLLQTKDLDLLVSVLSQRNQPLARMLYLTAFSPHRVQEFHLEEFRIFYKGQDKGILAAISWVSFISAIKIGERLGVKFKYEMAQDAVSSAN